RREHGVTVLAQRRTVGSAERGGLVRPLGELRRPVARLLLRRRRLDPGLLLKLQPLLVWLLLVELRLELRLARLLLTRLLLLLLSGAALEGDLLGTHRHGELADRVEVEYRLDPRQLLGLGGSPHLGLADAWPPEVSRGGLGHLARRALSHRDLSHRRSARLRSLRDLSLGLLRRTAPRHRHRLVRARGARLAEVRRRGRELALRNWLRLELKLLLVGSRGTGRHAAERAVGQRGNRHRSVSGRLAECCNDSPTQIGAQQGRE